MKKLNTLFLLLILTNTVFGQKEINKIVFDENANQYIFLGYCNIESFKLSPMSPWFLLEYDDYTVDVETLKTIKSAIIPELEISIIMGTWCSDSKREVPRFIKITDSLNLESNQLLIICVDRNKEAGKIPVERMGIELVPTFIFYYEGKEIGRIIESPKETLEKDMLNIISTILSMQQLL